MRRFTQSMGIYGIGLCLFYLLLPDAYAIAAEGAAKFVSRAIPDETYVAVDTGQSDCFDNTAFISCPDAGEDFYGQDAQHSGPQQTYTDNLDGTVTDETTKLEWQQSPDSDNDGDIDAQDKMTYSQALQYAETLNNSNFAGHDDWRLPSIKELYSLINFDGRDPGDVVSGSTAGMTPFIDTDYFEFEYGDQSAGERIIDSQYASSTLYTADSGKLFGVNFADGRIKGYDLDVGTSEKTFFVICVRNNTAYGENEFVDNGDDTISDLRSNLMWAKNGSGTGMTWKDALAWVRQKNQEAYLGYSDWRLPDAKELQGIVDYTRAPDQTSSPAIDALFSCTQITNEAGAADWPYYWTSTSHAADSGANKAVYLSFGRALGYVNNTWTDIHGAGAQRSDFKTGDPASYPTGHGPQGDAVRIYNYVRLVRGTPTINTVPALGGWGMALLIFALGGLFRKRLKRLSR